MLEDKVDNSINRTLAEAGLMESKKKYLFRIFLECAEIDFACAESLNVFLVNNPHERNKQLTNTLLDKEDLNSGQAVLAAYLMASPQVDLAAKQAFLIALSDKGETATEVAAFAAAFRKLALDPGVEAWASQAIDVCGTGGDGSSTFNISTAVSFIIAAAGVPVFKHGNRSITSKCGSADLIEGLGIRLDAPDEVIRESLKELNFCFFFLHITQLSRKLCPCARHWLSRSVVLFLICWVR